MGEIDLSGPWLGRLAASIQYCDAYASKATGAVYQGLFRVPASGDVLDNLKERVKTYDKAHVALLGLQDFRRTHPDKEESINAIASLLKWILRVFPVALVPFNFAMVDMSSFEYDRVTDDAERGRIGCRLAQDLILAMAAQLEAYDDKIVAEAISVVAQLLSMLCTVSRVDEIGMSEYSLSVPLIPSLCNARDPIAMVKEHTELQMFTANRRDAESKGTPPPISQLQLLIVYGHRIWGYVEHVMPSLEHAIKAIGEVSPSKGSEQRVRKRDVLKRILHKMKLSSKSHSPESPGSHQGKGEAHENFFKRLFTKKPADSNKASSPPLSANSPSALGRFARLEKSAAVDAEDLKRLGVGRAKSVRLESPIMPLQQDGLEHDETPADQSSSLVEGSGAHEETASASTDEDDCTDSEEQENKEDTDSKQTLGLHGVELLREYVAADSGRRSFRRSRTTRQDTTSFHKVSSADPIRRFASTPLIYPPPLN